SSCCQFFHKAVPCPQELRSYKPQDPRQQKGDQDLSRSGQPRNMVVQGLAFQCEPVVEHSDKSQHTSQQDEKPIILLRQCLCQCKLKDRVRPQHGCTQKIRRQGRGHDRQQHGHRKILVHLLQGEHDSRQGCVKGGCQPGAGPACQKISLLRLSPVKISG